MGLIERTQVLKMLDDMKARLNQNMQENEVVFLEIIRKKVEGMKGTKLKDDWIPCSERLPECEWGFETDPVLFQLKSGSIEVGYYGTGGKYSDRYFRTYRDVFEGFDAKDVIAWQPLPEPYQPTTPETSNPHLMASFTRVD